MQELSQQALFGVAMGIGATATMDLWALARRRLFGTPSLDWALVGRWLGHMPRGTFAHTRIAAAGPVPGERALGWIAHYAIGIAFALLLLAICGPGWAARPTLLPALVFGLVTVAIPFFVMQPAMGAGIAASKTPNPTAARINSLMTHAVFGIGLYLSASLLLTCQ